MVDTRTDKEIIIKTDNVSIFYGAFQAVRNVFLDIPKNNVVAFIGPSGCGKSTLLRCYNRLNDLIPTAKVQGQITYNGTNLYDPRIDPVEVRRRIGMVFQQPNPFPKSIYDNVAFGLKISGFKTALCPKQKKYSFRFHLSSLCLVATVHRLPNEM